MASGRRNNRHVEEAMLFYDYLKQEWPEGDRIHVTDIRELYVGWSERQPKWKRWRPLYETMKRQKALRKSGKKGGYFRITNDWPELNGTRPHHTSSSATPRVVFRGVQRLSPSTSFCNSASVTQQILHRFRQNKEILFQDKRDIEILCDCQTHDGRVPTVDLEVLRNTLSGPIKGEVTSVNIEVANKSTVRPVYLQACGFLQNDPAFTLHDERHVSGGLSVVTIGCGQKYTVCCSFRPQRVGVTSVYVAFTLSAGVSGEEDIFHIVRKVRGRCTTALAKEARSNEPYKRRRVYRPKPSGRIEQGQPPDGNSRSLPIMKLEKYDSKAIDDMIINGNPTEQLIDTLTLDLETNHAEVFHHLLWVEEKQMDIDIRNYDMYDAVMNVVAAQGGSYLALKVPGLAEKRPSLLRGDRLYAACTSGDRDIEFEGYVHAVRQEEVWLKFSYRFHHSVYMRGMTFNIRFTFNRLPLMLQHRALSSDIPSGVLFPLETHIGSIDQLPQSRFYDRCVERNEQQKMAVLHIVSGVSRPAPYIIYGPPGTGKTKTTVEAIRQVLAAVGGNRVLACTPSNSAADLVCQRLLESPVVSKSEVLRFNAMSRDERDIPLDLKGNSKYDLTMGELLTFRVVVCTLVTAGKIVSARVQRGRFTHIFVDESGHAVEPECLIPISGLLDPHSGQVVLAGDPQQLGPVLRSPLAIEHGLQVSLLERLMKRDVYQRRGDLPQDQPPHNPKAVTKLLKNYRSHPAILDQPNCMFYQNELKPCADEILRNKMCSWNGLKTQGFPLIFHGIVGEENQEKSSPSFFNPEEISLVCEYVEKLKDTEGSCRLVMKRDVGIISPYRKQVLKIRRNLEKLHMGDVKVGSVEEFQGQERTVVIISTVRSNSDYLEIDKKFNLGFLKNPKRFNVAVTRAKALLIVIGNPHLLIRDEHWKQFLEYIRKGGGYTGCPYPDEGSDDESILDNLQELGLHTTDAYEAAAQGESGLQQFNEQEWRGEH